MKKILLYLSIILLVSCSVVSNSEQASKAHAVSNQFEAADGTYAFDTAYTKHNQNFYVSTTDLSDDLVLLAATHNANPALTDTIQLNGLSDITFPDFNKDGYPDIMLTYMGNTGIKFLYLFSPVTNSFRRIEKFDAYPEAMQLTSNPALFYSYHKAGCADMNWISDLFKIEDFRIIHLGRIHGRSCEYDGSPHVVEIFKMQGGDAERKELVERHAYGEVIPDFADKWAFIETFWNEKFEKFE